LSDLIEVAVAYDVALAEVWRSVLAAEGIECLLFDSGFAGLLGGGYPGIRLMVAERDRRAAQRHLELPDNQA
jgi:hypothetical protein